MFKAQVVADSLSPQGDRLVSVLCTFPRIILAEVNTHRMLSKNTSSSRAIPFKKMVEAVNTNPFIPIAWQKDHSGMQGSQYINGDNLQLCINDWLEAKDSAIKFAERLDYGFPSYNTSNSEDIPRIDKVTKQICNRLLEPFMWTTMLITGSFEGGWDNFFNLRCPQYQHQNGDIFKSWKDLVKDAFNKGGSRDWVDGLESYSTLDRLKCNKGLAEIHMMHLAELIYDAFNESTPKQLKAGEWHIPFGDKINHHILNDTIYEIHNITLFYDSKINENIYTTEAAIKVSTAMGARTSYTIVGEEKEVSYEALIKLDDKLLVQRPPHSSPMEHCSRAMGDGEYQDYGKRYHAPGDNENRIHHGWCRNYRGFIQRRHLIETDQYI